MPGSMTGLCKALKKFTGIQAIGGASALRYAGWLAMLNGKQARVSSLWSQAFANAQRLHMPYEEALIHFEIGRHLPDDALERQEHFQQARSIFERIHAWYDLQRLQQGSLVQSQ